MKKFFIVALLIAFVSVSLTSCRSHERCAAYGKINKIKTEKDFSAKDEKSI